MEQGEKWEHRVVKGKQGRWREVRTRLRAGVGNRH